MKIKNLVDDFVRFVVEAGDTDGYIRTFPSLFQHYFRFWSDEKLPFFHNLRAIRKAEQMILKHLPSLEVNLSAQGLPLHDLHVVLFVGQQVSNGHAALLDGDWWVWLPVEAYDSTKKVDIFITHELVHGLQYAMHPELFFETMKQKNCVWRQIVTEGVATFMSMKIRNIGEQEALWADYLTDEEYTAWKSKYERKRKDTNSFLLRNWNGDSKGLFEETRNGYGAALEAMQTVAKNFDDPYSLLEIAPTELARHLNEALTKKSAEHA